MWRQQDQFWFPQQTTDFSQFYRSQPILLNYVRMCSQQELLKCC